MQREVILQVLFTDKRSDTRPRSPVTTGNGPGDRHGDGTTGRQPVARVSPTPPKFHNEPRKIVIVPMTLCCFGDLLGNRWKKSKNNLTTKSLVLKCNFFFFFWGGVSTLNQSSFSRCSQRSYTRGLRSDSSKHRKVRGGRCFCASDGATFLSQKLGF